MKKIIQATILTLLALSLINCANSNFGATPPPAYADDYSNELGNINDPGGVAAEIDNEDNKKGDAFIKENI